MILHDYSDVNQGTETIDEKVEGDKAGSQIKTIGTFVK